MTAQQRVPLALNGIDIGLYPDEGDAGGSKTYLSALNGALANAVQQQRSGRTVPLIRTVGWYAQTYPGERFTGSQLMPLVQDLKAQYSEYGIGFIYEASIMPFQSWSGYSGVDNRKAVEVAQVMQELLERSRVANGDFSVQEVRLKFAHEINYYITTGMYPPAADATNQPGAEFKQAFEQVAKACRALPHEYSRRIKMFYCPNIANSVRDSVREYERFMPSVTTVDYIGVDYYCPVQGCLTDTADFVRKLKPFHDKYSHPTRCPFILGETGLHFNGTEQQKLDWLMLLTSAKVRTQLPNLICINWFNYQKDRDYRILYTHPSEANTALATLLLESTAKPKEGKSGRKFWKTLLLNK